MNESGKRGEENLAYNLKLLPSEYKVIHNVNLNHRIESDEFYVTVIGPAGIFHIENKNEGGRMA
nr:nuclease-related domain-containing protein [Clostridium beijerinckii]